MALNGLFVNNRKEEMYLHKFEQNQLQKYFWLAWPEKDTKNWHVLSKKGRFN